MLATMIVAMLLEPCQNPVCIRTPGKINHTSITKPWKTDYG